MLSEEKLSKIIGDIADNYEQEDLFTIESGHQLPNRDAVIHIIMGLRQIMFPGYFDKEHLERTIPEYFLGHNIIRIYDTLSEQIRFALIREAKSQANLTEIKERTEEICEQFFSSFAHIQQLLLRMFKQLLMAIRPPRPRRRSSSVIRDCLLFLYIVWRMSCIA